MKKIQIYLSVLSAAFALSGCNDFLDINPRQNVEGNVLFTTEDGYKSALNGVYIMVASEDLYGKNTSFYLPELLCRTWTQTTDQTSLDYRLSNFSFDYENVENYINTIWTKYYKSIAQLNDIEKALINPTPRFNYENDKLIKGELLGLRAFLHLEVLRLFGPVPDLASNNEATIPYVTSLTKDPNKLISLSYSEVLKGIEDDLTTAEEILKNIDPVLEYSNRNLNTIGTSDAAVALNDSWHYYRQNRFNYFAVLGTKARFYHWIGKTDLAVKYAKMVINAVDPDGTLKFPLTNEASYWDDKKNLVFFSENLFAIQNPSHSTIIQRYFKDQKASLKQSSSKISTLYESGINTIDIRNVANRYWKEETYNSADVVNHFLKYTGNNDISPKLMVPLLRTAEMYLILIEDLPLSEASNYFATYRRERSMDSSLDATLTDEAARADRLRKEYQKEFFGEGQMFFYYKKHQITSYSWPDLYNLPNGVKSFVLPKPKSQTSFE